MTTLLKVKHNKTRTVLAYNVTVTWLGKEACMLLPGYYPICLRLTIYIAAGLLPPCKLPPAQYFSGILRYSSLPQWHVNTQTLNDTQRPSAVTKSLPHAVQTDRRTDANLNGVYTFTRIGKDANHLETSTKVTSWQSLLHWSVCLCPPSSTFSDRNKLNKNSASWIWRFSPMALFRLNLSAEGGGNYRAKVNLIARMEYFA